MKYLNLLLILTIPACAGEFNPDLGDVGGTDETNTDSSENTGTDDNDESGTDSTGSTDTGESVCGDSIVGNDEECDGTEFAGNTCADLGFTGGTLLCDPVNCSYDTSNCDQCGNGQIDPGESCDGEDLGDATTCADLDIGLASEFLSCDGSCNWDLSECSGCGDGTVAGPEECEPGPPELLDGATCESEGFDSGSLACTPGCGFDVSDCATCGDGIVGGDETCDGGNLAGKTCQTIGFTSGDLACTNECKIDASSCEGFQIERQARSIATGEQFTCAMVTGQVKCWGYGDLTATGLAFPQNVGDEPNEMGPNFPAIDFGMPATVVGIDGGGIHACALFDEGSVKCWGQGNSGQLGQGNTLWVKGSEVASIPAVDIPPVLDVATGRNFSCALLVDHTVKCWGENNAGQLGQGNLTNLGDTPNEMGPNLPVVDLGDGTITIAISVGAYFACALLDNGDLKCWGQNTNGQLGQGHTNDIGDTPGEMGNNLASVDFGDGLVPLAITTGHGHTCGLLSDNGLRCWGDTIALGQGDNLPVTDPNGLPAIDLGGAVPISIHGGVSFTCARLDNGTVKCWGYGDNGSLGQGNTESKGDSPNEMGNLLLPINLGQGSEALELDASCRSLHVCALLDDDGMKCWGHNSLGQLGQGDTETRGDNFGDMGDNLPPIDLE